MKIYSFKCNDVNCWHYFEVQKKWFQKLDPQYFCPVCGGPARRSSPENKCKIPMPQNVVPPKHVSI